MFKYYSFIMFAFFTIALTSCKGQNVQEEALVMVKEKEVFPTPIGFVNDFAGILSIEQREVLEKQLNEYEQKSTNEIAVVILDSVPLDKDFTNYCINLSNAWGVGKAEKNNGLMFILDNKYQRMRINTGNGTKKVLTDEVCNLVFNQVIVPNFKKRDYYAGIKYGLNELIRIWDDGSQEL